MNEPRVVFGEGGFASKAGWQLVYVASPQTGEYIGAHDMWVSAGTGLAAGAYLDAPPVVEPGKAILRGDSSWYLVEDHRGKLAFDTVTRVASEIVELGPLPAGQTLLPPGSAFDRWTGQAWIKDEVAEQQNRLEAAQAELALRIANANQQIAIIKPAVDGGYAKPEHTQLLSDWQRHRYELTMMPEQSGWPGSPKWPEQPESII